MAHVVVAVTAAPSTAMTLSARPPGRSADSSRMRPRTEHDIGVRHCARDFASTSAQASRPAQQPPAGPSPSSRSTTIDTDPPDTTQCGAVRPSRQNGRVLVVDAANVVGSRPTGWWRDRAGAARDLHRRVLDAVEGARLVPPVVLVVEGAARAGVQEGEERGVRVVHANGVGDDTVVRLVREAFGRQQPVTVVTADRGLRDRARRLGAHVVGPGWLHGRMDSGG